MKPPYELLVIVPSRGRPQNAWDLVQSWNETTRDQNSQLAIVQDDDDPWYGIGDVDIQCYKAPAGDPGFVAPLNWAVKRLVAPGGAQVVGFIGDDHRPRTEGWDARVNWALEEMGSGIVYGDDLFQGERLPTAVFMTADIVMALGWMAPPCLSHMYADNFWLELGRELGCLRYLPDVVIEHLHPVVGKAPSDATYARTGVLMDTDHERYKSYMVNDFDADVARVRLAIQQEQGGS